VPCHSATIADERTITGLPGLTVATSRLLAVLSGAMIDAAHQAVGFDAEWAINIQAGVRQLPPVPDRHS